MGTNTTPLGYRGNVSVRIKIGDKVVQRQIHNTGMMQLKRAFAMAMAGNENAFRYVPSKMDLRGLNPLTDSWDNGGGDSVLKRSVNVSSLTYDRDDGVGESQTTIYREPTWYTLCSASLPYSSLAQAIQGTWEYRLYLLANYSDERDDSKELAYISVDTDDLLTLEPGVMFLIEWKLELLNEIPQSN